MYSKFTLLNYKLLTISLLAIIILTSCGKNIEADYNIIPKINDIEFTTDSPFILTKETRIIYPANNLKLEKNAKFLSDYIFEETSIRLKIEANKKNNIQAKAIILSDNLINSNTEAYNISINSKLIKVNASSDKGIFYGIQSLRKFLPTENVNKISFPSADIHDKPRFAYRGGMLDVSRHFFQVAEIKKFIDILALHNLNVFHFHLTDDQGWRIEIKKYPLLTEIGSKRAQTLIGNENDLPKIYDGKPYSGFYTQEQIKDIIQYATERYITVIPEIDLPGHMSAALAAYPKLGCTDGPYKVEEGWGIFPNTLCAGKESVYLFIQDVLNEVMDLFPSPYIHIGGDECVKKAWRECSLCQNRIKKLGLKTDKHSTKEQKLQSHITSFAESIINARGRKMIGWDEILEGGLSENAIVMSWQGTEGGIKASKLGHDAIMSPIDYVYFNYYQTKDTTNQPLAKIGYLPLKKVYSYEAIDSTFTSNEAEHILGIQANLWSVYIPTFDIIEYMLLPRLSAISEIAWSTDTTKDYNDFLNRLTKMSIIYDNLEYKNCKSYE